jgi:3-deoxy-D-manno-octulosonate 8-phosphate phosphatase (KDO 8-P phosphatase)
MTHIDKELLMTKACNIRLLALDVDGVLTDGSIIYTSQREQVQSFHVHDGLGLKLLSMAGIHVAILSSRSSHALAIRAEELGIKLVYQGLSDKIEVYERIKEKLEIKDKEIAYIGDDWVDLPLLQKAGLAIVVADATQSMKGYADYITQQPGGRGAVREVCELILKAQNRRSEFLNRYLNL